MKKVLSISIVLSLFLSFGNLAIAKNDKNYAPDSEVVVEGGTYDVVDHPELKVHIFVYKQKAKPIRSTSSLVTCGLTDPDSDAVTGDAGWRLPLSVSYWLNSGSVPSSVGGNNLSVITNNGFGVWQMALGVKARTLTPAGTTSADRARYDGKNIIAWGRTSGSALAVTYTWYYTSTKQVAEVDTIMNKKFPWSWNGGDTACADNSSYDAQNILTHELGHWYGLNDHLTDGYVNNTMYGYGSRGEVKKDTLTTGDIIGVQNLY